MRAVLIALLLISPMVSRAAMPVEVLATAEDSVGSRLAYSVKEKLRSSLSLELTFDESAPRLQVRLVTLDAHKEGSSTMYSLVMTWAKGDGVPPFFLYQITGACGSSQIDACADRILANVSDQSDQIIRALQNHTRR